MSTSAQLAFAGVLCLLGAIPWHLRARGTRGTYAVRPWWLVVLGLAFLLAALVLAP